MLYNKIVKIALISIYGTYYVAIMVIKLHIQYFSEQTDLS